MKPFIKSIQIGKVKTLGDKHSKKFLEKYWETGSFKEEISDKITVNAFGILGDAVADTINHGGLDKAVFANSYENYPKWKDYLQMEDNLSFGALAENLTISGLDEATVFLGDIHYIGTATLQVVQPRKPCWKISKKFQNKNFTNEIYTSGLTGWYYRILKSGDIFLNNPIEIFHNEDTQISILEANLAFANPKNKKEVLEKIISVTSICESYRQSIIQRLENTFDLSYMNTTD